MPARPRRDPTHEIAVDDEHAAADQHDRSREDAGRNARRVAGEVVEPGNGVEGAIGDPRDRVVLDGDTVGFRPGTERQHVIRPRTQRDRIRRARNKQTHAYGVSLLEGDHEGPASPGDRTGVRCGARPGPRRHAEIRGGDKRQVERIDDASPVPRRAGLLERVAAAGREGERQEGESSHREAVSTRSQYTKRASRTTTGPRSCRTGARRPGPAYTNVWNSPFSPHGSTSGGRSCSRPASNSRPANPPASCEESTHTSTARYPIRTNSCARARVSRSHSGNSPRIPIRASMRSR